MTHLKTTFLKILTAIFLVAAFAHPAIAADTVQDQATKVIKQDPRNHIITAVYENDLIGDGSDGEYTSGVRLSYIDLGAEFPGWAKDVARAIPTFDINQTSSIFYSIGQNIFTPRSVVQTPPDNRDRPWAGYLYASIGMATLTDNHSDTVEVSLGVVGSGSLAEQTQKFIHKNITDSPEPKGWDYQLHNEPALLLAWERSYPETWASTLGPLSFSTSPYYGVTLGNVYTFADAGFSFRLRPETSKWQDTPVRVRPALPGTGFFEIPEKKWSWYLFGGVEGRAIARNIFLDGNTFKDSPSVDKNYFVADANAGAAITYDQIRLSYTLVYRTKEFKTQADPETFGALSLGYRF